MTLCVDRDEDISWVITTISKITSLDHFWSLFKEKSTSPLAREIIQRLEPFTNFGMPGKKKASSVAKLANIIVEAGKIAVESWKMPSRFHYILYEPGDDYNASSGSRRGRCRERV